MGLSGEWPAAPAPRYGPSGLERGRDSHRAGGGVMKTLYLHPDGEGEIFFEAATGRLFTSNDAEGLRLDVLIGPAGLRDVAAEAAGAGR